MVVIKNEGLAAFVEKVKGLDGVKDPKELYYILMRKMYKLRNINVTDFGPFLSVFSVSNIDDAIDKSKIRDVDSKKKFLRELHKILTQNSMNVPKKNTRKTINLGSNYNTPFSKGVLRTQSNKFSFEPIGISRPGSVAPSRRSSIVNVNEVTGVMDGGKRRHRKTRKHSRKMKRRCSRKSR
jgi:hypothetical protein